MKDCERTEIMCTYGVASHKPSAVVRENLAIVISKTVIQLEVQQFGELLNKPQILDVVKNIGSPTFIRLPSAHGGGFYLRNRGRNDKASRGSLEISLADIKSHLRMEKFQPRAMLVKDSTRTIMLPSPLARCHCGVSTENQLTCSGRGEATGKDR